MLIDYQNATIEHDDGALVLKEVNFKASEGEFVYVIGRVGTGKSSLLKTMCMEKEVANADKAEVLGVDLLSLKQRQVPALRRQMGIVSQDFQLLTDRNVQNNLRFVLKATGWKDKRQMDERIETVMSRVGMMDKLSSMPYELSGGEQQRVAIARALLNNPKIVIADEPTANLDPETASQLTALLHDISQHGAAVVMSTHNMKMLEQFPGIVYRCEGGRIEEKK